MHIAINGLFLQRLNTGTGQYVLRLLNALAAVDQANTYTVCLEPQGYRPLIPGQNVRFALMEGPFLSPSWRKLYVEQVAFPLTCRRAGARVAHVPHFAPPLVKACPTVVTIHDLITMLLPEYRRSPQVRAYNALIAVAARRADAIIADSLYTQRDITRILGIPGERIRVVYLAVDDRFRPITRASDLSAVRQRYGLPEDYIFYIGGLNRHKNVTTLLQAFAALRYRLPRPYSLAIAGRAHADNPAIYPDLLKLARELGLTVAEGTGRVQPEMARAEVQFLRFVPEEDKPFLYNAARLFVFPSLYEGFGLPPLEAMACGTPVVCSKAASLPEVVGDAALLVDPNSPVDLAQAMLAALTDESLRATLRQRGLAQAARFSWEKTARETLRVFEEVSRQR